jgi:hypothetical protein
LVVEGEEKGIGMEEKEEFFCDFFLASWRWERE